MAVPARNRNPSKPETIARIKNKIANSRIIIYPSLTPLYGDDVHDQWYEPPLLLAVLEG